MTVLSFILIGIVALFSLFVLFRSILSLQVCALCAAVSTTWIALLLLFYTGVSIDPVLVGILIGGSVVGSMYLLEKKLPERFHVFRLPFFLTFVSVGYWLLGGDIVWLSVFVLLVVWLLVGGLFIWRNTSKLKLLVQEIINCCKNW
ncbi:MAG: hypothetical protein WD552_00295 [Candidatus Paceibacterota bacterium]